MRPGCLTDRNHPTHGSQPFVLVSPDWIPSTYLAGNHRLSLHAMGFLLFITIRMVSSNSDAFCLGVGITYPFTARVSDSRPSVLLHPRQAVPQHANQTGAPFFWNHRIFVVCCALVTSFHFAVILLLLLQYCYYSRISKTGLESA